MAFRSVVATPQEINVAFFHQPVDVIQYVLVILSLRHGSPPCEATIRCIALTDGPRSRSEQPTRIAFLRKAEKTTRIQRPKLPKTTE
jgi:hypothetical protein